MQPPNHTPLVTLSAVILDLETTGLDTKNDQVVQIGAFSMSGSTLDEKALFDQLIKPGIPIPASSSKIHHIHDSDVSSAPAFKDIATKLTSVLKNNVIIGHHIAFDMAILRQEYARHNLVWHEPVSLDTSMVTAALQPNLPDVSLESIATLFGVTISDRHSARGDCIATAQCWQKLIPMLQENGIRTLGETISLANQRQDMIMRQVESGWMDKPDGLVEAGKKTLPRIDSYIFEHRVADVMAAPISFIQDDTTLRNAAQIIVEQGLSGLPVVSSNDALQGILTENDIMRFIATGSHDMDTTLVNDIMSKPVESIHQDEMLYRALARMDSLSIGHLCVINDDETPVGIISRRNLLQYRARGINMVGDALETAEDTNSLAAAYARVTAVTQQLLNEGMTGTDIAQVISSEIQALTQRAAQLAMQRMESEGEGPAPSDWCVLILGSGGRGESLLAADQDNALIHTGNEKDDAWFEKFGHYLAEILDVAGLPLCKGNVMISNQQWRGTLDDWNKRVSNWLQRAHPEDLLNIDIFFDLLPVAGNSQLANALHTEAVSMAAKTHTFINLLAQSVLSVSPQFGAFGRLPLTNNRLDLKRNGLLPLVSFARTIALRIGSTARSTPDRIRDVIKSGRISEGDAVRLIELQKTLLTLILQQQLKDAGSGIPPGSHVEIKELDKPVYKNLVQELKHLDTMVMEIQSFITAKQ